jgi:uncharacterized phage protein gp47/JayE
MPFTRPALQDLIARAAADIEGELVGTDALLRRSLLRILGRMHAGGMHGLYGFLQYVMRQLFVESAEGEFLDLHATRWGVPRLAATFAQGPAIFTGTAGTVPAGTQVQRSDGTVFETLADGTLASGSVTVSVRALVAGVAGNTDTASALSLVTPVGGFAAAVMVATPGIEDGLDSEGDDSLRARVLQYIRSKPGVGTKADYERWARSVAGVTRAWCFPLEGGPGFVVVRFMRDNDASGPIPDSGEVAAVQAYIDSVRPVRGTVTVSAPTADAMNPRILLTPDTPATRVAVTAQLNDLLLREAAPGGTLPLTHIQNAIDEAAGVTDYTLLSPTTNVVSATGHISTLGVPTWT